MEEIGYIYKISFINSNDIYIGKTINYDINNRLKQHLYDKNSSVYIYVKKNNYDIKNIKIEILDKINMKDDITNLLNHSYNIKNNIFCKYHIIESNIIKSLSIMKLGYLERYYIYNYYNDDRYNLINKIIYKNEKINEIYLFLKNKNL